MGSAFVRLVGRAKKKFLAEKGRKEEERMVVRCLSWRPTLFSAGAFMIFTASINLIRGSDC
jgi:hypothetical protein